MGSQAGTSQEALWGRSFSISIYFMLFVIHVLIGTAIYKVYKLIKNEEKRYAKVPSKS